MNDKALIFNGQRFDFLSLTAFQTYRTIIFSTLYLSSFKLPLCWLHSLTPVTSFSMLPGIRFLAVAIHLEIHWVYMIIAMAVIICLCYVIVYKLFKIMMFYTCLGQKNKQFSEYSYMFFK